MSSHGVEFESHVPRSETDSTPAQGEKVIPTAFMKFSYNLIMSVYILYLKE
jgi:hypothetical protein